MKYTRHVSILLYLASTIFFPFNLAHTKKAKQKHQNILEPIIDDLA